MKNALLLLHGPRLTYRDVLNRRLLFQNKPAAVAPRETITIILITGFWNWAKKTVDAAKICGGMKILLKPETQQTFVNGLLGFITLGIYTPLEARVYCSQ